MKTLTETAKIKAAETYNAAADHFDDAPLSFWNRYGNNTISRLSLSPRNKVLDVACGSGASAIPAAKIVGVAGKVTAVDLADNLLQLGRSKKASLGLTNIEFVTGDMTDLPYPDESFDAVVCVFGVFFVPDMELLIKQLWRMVKPGGKLAITTWGPDFFAPMYDIWREAVKRERPDLHSAFNPWDRITEIRAVKDLFLSAGIVHAEVVAATGSQPLYSPEDWWTIVMGSGLRWTVDKMGIEVSMRVREQNLAWIRDHNISSISTNVIYAVAQKGVQ